MAKGLLRVLWMAVWVSVAASAALKMSGNLPGHEFFRTVPKSEQPDFLTFELGRAYKEEALQKKHSRFAEEEIVFPDDLDIEENLMQKFETLAAPENFTQNLFNFVQSEFDLDQGSIRTLILSRSICLQSGLCLDMDDVGAFCCPF